jgi:dTMP kinase
MNFVVIEGLDGSGKSTQIKLLREYLVKQNIKHKYLHFPRTDTPVYGELIARFLRGESGDIKSVDPYLVALLYAGDRNDAKTIIKEWLMEGYFVLVDRYVNSNIAFQCAKLNSESERLQLKNWIIQLEYHYNQLPVPDLNIFLDVPFNFTENQLLKERKGEDREYLNGRADIHEADLDFQKNVREVYLSLEGKDDKYKILNCSGTNQTMLIPNKIFNSIVELIF